MKEDIAVGDLIKTALIEQKINMLFKLFTAYKGIAELSYDLFF